MSTKPWAVFTVLFTTLLTSGAQLLWKKGVDSFAFDFMSLITNTYLLAGILLYVIGGALIIVSFRGGEVSVLYPIIATSYVWVSFLSIYFLHELMNIFKWAGIISIIAGIVFIGTGTKVQAPGIV